MILKDEGRGGGGKGWEPNTETSGSLKPERCGARHSRGSLSALFPSTASQAITSGKSRFPGGALGRWAKGDAELSGCHPGLSITRLAPKAICCYSLNPPFSEAHCCRS